MKLAPVLLAAILAGTFSVNAQQSAPATSGELSRQNPRGKLAVSGVKKETYAGGVFSRTYKNGRELRLVNPLYLNPAAPAALGNGADNLVFNPYTGAAEGFSILSYRF